MDKIRINFQRVSIIVGSTKNKITMDSDVIIVKNLYGFIYL
jgi:hypothetical protein